MPHQTQRIPAQVQPPAQARRITAASADAILALLCGLAAGGAAGGVNVVDGVVEIRPLSPSVWGTATGAAIAVSFLNHVLLTVAVRASLGKLLTGLRVVRSSDGGRPGFFRLIGRWLCGFYLAFVIVPLSVVLEDDPEHLDAVGLRTLRR